jgi:hypothetical protein
MPQNTVLPDWRATYPILAPAQKPGGVTVLTVATAPRVPNKPTYVAGTIQMVSVEEAVAEEAVVEEAVAEEPVAEEAVAEEPVAE